MATSVPPAAPIRKKRNFKALQLDVTKSSTPAPDPQPAATRAAPAPAARGKKRPPPMKLAAPKIPATDSSAAGDGDNTLLAVPAPNSAPATGVPSASRANYHSTLSSTLASLEISENSYRDLRNEDLKDLHELGQGNGGSVKLVEHVPTGTIMAKKVRNNCPPSSECPTNLIGMVPLDRPHRREAVGKEADPSRTSDHARLPLAIHHLLLRRVHLRP